MYLFSLGLGAFVAALDVVSALWTHTPLTLMMTYFGLFIFFLSFFATRVISVSKGALLYCYGPFYWVRVPLAEIVEIDAGVRLTAATHWIGPSERLVIKRRDKSRPQEIDIYTISLKSIRRVLNRTRELNPTIELGEGAKRLLGADETARNKSLNEVSFSVLKVGAVFAVITLVAALLILRVAR
jgi:hypothetical protein